MEPDLLNQLVARLGAHQRKDRRYYADCPFCGKPECKAQKHFSFGERGYYCWVCGAKGGLRALAQHVALATDAPAYTPKPAEPRKPAHWEYAPERYLEAFCTAPSRLPDWQAYKPLSIESIAKYRLGVGKLPSSRCEHRRLIVPVFDGDTIVAFHGRAYLPADTDAKWLTAGGSRKDVLFNAGALREGATVIVCENMIDCLLAQQHDPNVVAVAGGGVNWRDEWSQQIAASRPRSVVVWLDNDLVGCPNPVTREALTVEWHATMRQRVQAGTIPRIPEPPMARGPQIANTLLSLRVPTQCVRWPDSTPPKADLGWALMRGAL